MKNIYKILMLSMIIVATTASCTDSELPIDNLYDNVNTSGAFIRTLSPPLELVNISDTTKNFIAMSIEVQEGNGSIPSTFAEVRVFAGLFNDQDQIEPTVDDQGNPIPEVLLGTITASEFVPSEINNLPSTDIFIPTQTIVDNAPGAVFTFPTFIYVRMELLMEDGTIYTDTNVGPTVATGDYFDAPFFYNIIFLPN